MIRVKEETEAGCSLGVELGTSQGLGALPHGTLLAPAKWLPAKSLRTRAAAGCPSGLGRPGLFYSYAPTLVSGNHTWPLESQVNFH